MENYLETPSILKLNWLIEQKRNDELISILSAVKPLHSINNEASILLHTAAMNNNVDIIKYLIYSGYDINSRNHLGQTPLEVALLSNNFSAVRCLLSLDADVFTVDDQGRSTFRMCFRRNDPRLTKRTIIKLFKRLKRYDLTAERMVDKLTKVDCSVDQTVFMKDAKVLKLMLDRQTSMSSDESRCLLKRAMRSRYLKNVRVVIKHGPRSDERMKEFFDKVTYKYSKPKNRPFLKQLIKWRVINELAQVTKIGAIFAIGDLPTIQTLLDINIDEYVRKKFGCELLATLFLRRRFDFIELLKNRQFDVNGLDPLGWHPLHLAASVCNIKGIAYLLENGANPNLKCAGHEGKTALFYAKNEKVVECLLDGGADVQLLDDNGNTVADVFCSRWIVAEVSILKARGLTIHEKLSMAMRKEPYKRKHAHVKLFCDQLVWMKIKAIFAGSSTPSFFNILVDDVDTVADYVKDEKTAARIIQVCRNGRRKVHPIFEAIVTKKLNRALEVPRLKPDVARFFSQVMKLDDCNHLVIERIVSYLKYKELLAVYKIFSDGYNCTGNYVISRAFYNRVGLDGIFVSFIPMNPKEDLDLILDNAIDIKPEGIY